MPLQTDRGAILLQLLLSPKGNKQERMKHLVVNLTENSEKQAFETRVGRLIGSLLLSSILTFYKSHIFLIKENSHFSWPFSPKKSHRKQSYAPTPNDSKICKLKLFFK